MNISDKIASVFRCERYGKLKGLILEIAHDIHYAEEGEKLVPYEAFEVVGITRPDEELAQFWIGDKEYYYFQKCKGAFEAFKSGDYRQAESLLLDAKWDINEWALAHYLLGLIYMEERRFKDALDQFSEAVLYEPYNTRPMAILKDLMLLVLKNSQEV